MKKILLFLSCLFFISQGLVAQSPNILWAQTFGGPGNDEAYDIKKTSDGGFIICGMTESKGRGGLDAWVIKLDPQGKLEWDRTYGDKGDEVANSIIQTRDGGYAFIGSTTSKGRGRRSVYLVKIDSAGNQQWEAVYGGSKDDVGNGLIETYDGNYAIVGSTRSFGPGNWDIWVIKVDTKGNRLWRRTEGGRAIDLGNSIAENPRDSSIVVVGTTFSYSTGQSDLWLIKITKDGRREWRKNYGSTNKDSGNHLTIKSTGEYIIAGSTQPKGERYPDYWVVGFTAENWDDWEQSYGTSRDDVATGSSETTDGGIIVCGYTNSYGEGSHDFWIMKFDKDGKQLWQETFGGPDEELANAVVAIGKNEAVIAGSTRSDGEGKRDFWVIYLK